MINVLVVLKRSTRSVVLINNKQKGTQLMSKREKLDYRELSKTHKCRICKKAIKQRLIDIKTVKPTLCYKHYILQENIRKYLYKGEEK